MPTLRSLRAAASANTGEVWVPLVTIAHPELAALSIERPELGISGGVMRFAAALEDVESRGEIYKAFAFEWTEPEQSETGTNAGSLRIDNVDRRITEVLRRITGKPQVTVEIVLAAAPDVVDRAYPDFEASGADWNATSVELTLQVLDDDNEPATAWKHTPSFSPGIF